jgi:hypothetical protein
MSTIALEKIGQVKQGERFMNLRCPSGLSPFGRRVWKMAVIDHVNSCKICKTTDNGLSVDDFNRDYTNWYSYNILKRKYSLRSDVEIERHVQLFKLEDKKRKNPEALLAQLAERGVNALKDRNITAANVLDAADKLIRMQGGYKDSLTINAGLMERINVIRSLNPEQMEHHRQKLIEMAKNPNTPIQDIQNIQIDDGDVIQDEKDIQDIDFTDIPAGLPIEIEPEPSPSQEDW